jgi:hypothetical protein
MRDGPPQIPSWLRARALRQRSNGSYATGISEAS